MYSDDINIFESYIKDYSNKDNKILNLIKSLFISLENDNISNENKNKINEIKNIIFDQKH
tara:strand:- start:159 stop:338 length:180 start_codon:yes stop_codon:yes gene_type:complete